jgi:hypothetical protein
MAKTIPDMRDAVEQAKVIAIATVQSILSRLGLTLVSK